VKRKENAAQLLTVMKSGGWIPEACSVTVVSWIFKAEAWGQGSRERDSSRCLIPAGRGRDLAWPTAGRRRSERRSPHSRRGASRSQSIFTSPPAAPKRDGPICHSGRKPALAAGAVRRVDPSAAHNLFTLRREFVYFCVFHSIRILKESSE
jgi:hypothetical protein